MVEEGLGERLIYLCMCAGGIMQNLPPLRSHLPRLFSFTTAHQSAESWHKKEAGIPASQPPTAV